MAEALLGIVIQNLQSFGQDQLATFWGVDKQTLKLSSNLSAIRAVLRDAERKQITSHAVKDWLQKLTDAAYVLDDILDECSIHFTKMHSDDGHTSCLSRLHPSDILFRFNIGKRMEDITQRFHDIHEEKSKFNLEPGVTEVVQTVDDDWRQTSSDITEPVVYGRDHDRHVEVEDVGDKVWKKLYRRSFFEEAKSDEFGIIRSFKMHDLFHDLAQSIMGEECMVIEKGSWTPLSTRVHYLANFNKYVDMPASMQFMTAFKKVESLRTFLNFGTMGQLPSNNCLRALCTTSSLFSRLNDVRHLRYLSLSWSSVAILDNTICQLPKLQTLKLEYYPQISELPKDLTQLQDLRHIVINYCALLQEMPANIGKLRHLRTLSFFSVGSKPGCGLAELHSLNLGGELSIRGLKNVSSEWDAKQANLIDKKDLNILHLSWDGDANSEGSNVSEEIVLEALQPPSTLKSFGINGYQGRQLSSWMRNTAVLRDLVNVTLFNCDNCEELPPLGKLPYLKSLYVSGMKNVKCIDGESYDGGEDKAFPSLEKLNVQNLPNLERLLRDEGVEMLPCLSRLTINGVFNLKIPHLPSAKELDASRIDEAASFIEGVGENMACLKTLKISSIKGVKTLPDQLGMLDALERYLQFDKWFRW
ncbi:disease resistance protein RPM1 [Vigna unguiculata]|uniref:Disease resistance protein RPM1 n=1 Tax=Vigna unguiculata TaxID=3917 RepID=A0A4D6LR73_VIGUN|nr:disease resistance protein RPM1 [Vigna unguiculata]